MLLLLVSSLLLCGFSAVGLLDGLPIDYYDSTTKTTVPKESWMKQRLEADYWTKGTESRKTKEQWFQVNLHILAQRLGKNDTVNHVFQWSRGCELSDNNKVRGHDRYSYDGDDFLSFDSDHKQWVAHMSEAEEIKRKWDGIQQLNDYTDGYLHKECVEWLQRFMKYRNLAMKNACFYLKEITMKVKRDRDLLDHGDGLKSTNVRPNGDGTHQIKMWVKIPKSDGARYTCEVIHEGSDFNLTREWGERLVMELLTSSCVCSFRMAV
ncbi:hypothetical protein CRUP_035911 [Coryphaenoides rupestris]|nr:hypothetical protein CRUP_035911 [Coryphaenoides rupestris]